MLYQYEAAAFGHPPPYFSLSAAPAGMTIDQASGVLTWTPTSGDVGDHQVTVNATNSVGTNSQTFTLRVSVVPAGLIAYWSLDEAGGSVFRDFFEVNNAVCVAPTCPLPAAGQVNGGQGFNDVTATRISAPAHPSLDFGNTDSFSLEAWVKTDLAAEVTYLGRLDSNDTLEYSIGHDVAGRPWFYLRDSLGNRITNLIAPSVAPFNQWHHIVGVMDANAQQARIYVDGVLANTKSTAGVFAGTFSSPTAAMDLGWLNLHGGYHLRGTLDELALYGRALGASEIANHYANGLAGIGIAGGTTNSAPVVANAISDQSGTYGAEFTFQFAANTFADPNGDPLTYTATGMPNGITFNPATTNFSGTPTEAGDFVVEVLATDVGALSATNNFTISIAKAPLSVAANVESKVYGAADPALSYTVGGLQASDTAAVVLTGGLTRAAGEAVGGYAITQGTLLANANYTICFTGNTLSITPAPLSVAANVESKVYGAADPALSYAVGGLQAGDTAAVVLTGGLTRAAGEAVGGYAITQGTLLANANYTISFTGNTLSITPAPLSVAANVESKVYGAADPALSYAVGGLQAGDTAAVVLTGGLTRAAGEAVGGYAITQGTLLANANYTISFTGNTLSITPAPLSVAANVESKVYGAADPALSYAVGGLQAGDTAAVVLTGGLTRAAGEAVGGYAITQGTLLANANYTISFTGNTLSITPAPLSVAANVESKVYGAADPALSYAVGGLQAGDTAAVVLTGGLTRAAGEAVGGYAITQGTLLANANYTISFTGNTLSITPAPLSVAANVESKVYGAADPALSYAVGGLQAGDTAAVVLTGGLTRAAGEAVGGYAITQGTLLANANYTISFTGNTLSITPAPLSVAANGQSKVYGAVDPALSYAVGGLQAGDTAAAVLTGGLARVVGEAVGGYAINQGHLVGERQLYDQLHGQHAEHHADAAHDPFDHGYRADPRCAAVERDQQRHVSGASPLRFHHRVGGLGAGSYRYR